MKAVRITFPCAFPIRVMGCASPGFERMVLDLVAHHAPDRDASRVSRRQSRAGRYLSVALVVQARSRAQLDAIYRDLSGHAQIAFVL
jgi:putative lipoic acid-binding regulatory protein